jgi:16S rRNA (guanine527-N7)-methyltransferase
LTLLPCYAGRVLPEPASISSCLIQFGISLDTRQIEQVSKYAALLLRWNRAINLTAIRNPGEILVRHFAESMYVTTFAELRGRLLDVGSGAGFPGLALKIARPDLNVVLLEPVAKKRAFLKEVARECGLKQVEVRGDRVEDFCPRHASEFEFATVRAVGDFSGVLRATAQCLASSGRIYLWLTKSEAARLDAQEPAFNQLFAWSQPIPVPLSRDREIWSGSRASRATG